MNGGTASVRRAASAICHGGTAEGLPASLRAWIAARALETECQATADDLVSTIIRGRPRLAVVDARDDACGDVVKRLKLDSYTAVVPVLVVTRPDSPAAVAAAFAAGADEVISDALDPLEVAARLDALLARSDRDTGVHPSTRLPGAPEIEAEYGRRLRAREKFAVCYVDLDHFKEFNDRYSYDAGDRVIRILAKILHDVVKGTCGERGFVGHIGGDDFICVLPHVEMDAVCREIVAVFDTLIPFQYSMPDRTTGYYFGKDRRGKLHRVPLMTVSIGVVTNAHRDLTHPAQISELATEMKSYAKTFSGSVYVVDRRQDGAGAPSSAPATPSNRAAAEGR